MSPVKIFENVARLHGNIAACHPKLRRGKVWCTECGREADANSAECLRHGWPTCCGYTMTIDSPGERKSRQEASDD